MPEGFALSGSTGTSVVFSDGTESFYFSSADYWKRLGRVNQEYYAGKGIDRAMFNVSSLSKESVAPGADAAEETHGGLMWYAAKFDSNGLTGRRWVTMDNGHLFVLTAVGENAAAAAAAVMDTLNTAGLTGNE